MERSSPSRTAGVCIRKVTLGGVSYTLSQPDKVRKAMDEEAVVIARRQLPRGLSPEERSAAMAALVCGIAYPEEWSAYWRSLWNPAFRFWNALDPADRDKALGRRVLPDDRIALLEGVEWAYDVLSGEDVTPEEREAFYPALSMVSQDELVKNSSGSPTEGTPVMASHTTEDSRPSTPGA